MGFTKFMRRAMAPAVLGAAVAVSTGAMASSFVYETGSNDPWGNNTNDQAMDSAFGAGNWTKSNGFDLGLFSGAQFVFLDGSDSDSAELETFLTANSAAIQNYVANGGRIFINDAPNGGSNTVDFGFGVTMNWGGGGYPFASNVANATAAGISAGLFNGIATSYTGDWFAHSTVTGPITDLLDGSAGIIFGVEGFGSGLAAFGGQTTDNFHSPSADAKQLLVNELLFAANGAAPNVPEPASLAVMGAGLAGLVAARRRKKD